MANFNIEETLAYVELNYLAIDHAVNHIAPNYNLYLSNGQASLAETVTTDASNRSFSTNGSFQVCELLEEGITIPQVIRFSVVVTDATPPFHEITMQDDPFALSTMSFLGL